MRLFALHSRCDDFKVQGVIDYLEEMARNFMTEPGTESYGPSETRESQDIVFRHDRWFERSIIIFNSRIGDRILKLTGSSNAEARFFGDAPDEDLGLVCTNRRFRRQESANSKRKDRGVTDAAYAEHHSEDQFSHEMS